jgi:hypothetical protein
VTVRSGLRATIRAELNDSGGTPLWSDALLNEWIAEAIRDYGRNLPRQSVEAFSSVAAQAEYALAARCAAVARVEHPSGCIRVEDPLSPGDDGQLGWAGGGVCAPFGSRLEVEGAALAYEVWGPPGNMILTLRPAPTASGESIEVRELQTYAEPSADGDTLATPGGDDDLLIWFVCNRALQWLGTDESKRQRWERDRGITAQRAAGQYERDYRSELRRRQRRVAQRRLVVRP